MDTLLSRKFSLRLPLIVAPMAGGPTTPALVAESSNAGALGSLGAAYLTPEKIQSAIDEVRAKTSKPYAINLFAPMPEVKLKEDQVQIAITATRGYREELGIASPKLSPPFHPDFDQQFEVVLRNQPQVFSFVFGLLDRAYLKECQKLGILTMGTATTLEEAIALEESGVDAIVAQGFESGGHHGIFDPEIENPGMGVTALTRSLVAKLNVPVVAAGGIMDGNGIAAMLALGADAVQMGTAFLLCKEAGTSPPYREALIRKGVKKTQITRAFSGRWARGLENRFMSEMSKKPQAILPFPAQNAFTRDIRTKSAQMGSSEFLSLWAGEGVDLIRADFSASDLIDTLVEETRGALSAMGAASRV
ncbi:MAG: NAD(P)H-dependent flavin oxidoreductase [Bdellovibrionia bacterium]